MDKTSAENKLARNIETKAPVTAVNCPAKSEHTSYLGRVHPPCGELIPIGQVYTDAEFKRLFEIDTSAKTSPAAYAGEEAQLWRDYQEADAERARITGDMLRADRELISLKAQSVEASYKRGTGDNADAAAVARKIEENGARRIQLAEALEAVVDRERVIQLKITRVGQRRETERRRLAAAPTTSPSLVERARQLLR